MKLSSLNMGSDQDACDDSVWNDNGGYAQGRDNGPTGPEQEGDEQHQQAKEDKDQFTIEGGIGKGPPSGRGGQPRDVPPVVEGCGKEEEKED